MLRKPGNLNSVLQELSLALWRLASLSGVPHRNLWLRCACFLASCFSHRRHLSACGAGLTIAETM